MSTINARFPFDDICKSIFSRIHDRNFHVPGIKVDLSSRLCFAKIENYDFKISFGREAQCVSEIIIPKKRLCVYEDESGPNLYIYVGNNYERDRYKFMGMLLHSRLHGEPRMYLKYTGGCDCMETAGASFGAHELLNAKLSRDSQIFHTHIGCRQPLLVHDNDLGREYDLEGDEPKFFQTSEIFEEFRKYLEEIYFKIRN